MSETQKRIRCAHVMFSPIMSRSQFQCLDSSSLYSIVLLLPTFVAMQLSLSDSLSLLSCFFRFVYCRSRYSSKQETETSGKRSQAPEHRGDLFGLSIVEDSYCVFTLLQVTSGIQLIPQTNNAVRVYKHTLAHLNKIVRGREVNYFYEFILES